MSFCFVMMYIRATGCYTRRVKGQWTYLYRAVDKVWKTVDFL